MKNLFFVMAGVVIALSSCKKDDDPVPTKMELLTKSVWVLTALEANGQILKVQQCSNDDKITFSDDGDLDWDYGSDKCSPSAPSRVSGTWEFRKNNNEILWDFNGSEQRLEILTLSATGMRLKEVENGTIMNFEKTTK